MAKKLTRYEIWNTITSAYPSLKTFSIGGAYGERFQKRDKLVKVYFDLGCSKSKLISKEDRKKMIQELEGNL